MNLSEPGPMTLPAFRDALDAALAGAVLSDTGASERMEELLIEVATTLPGTESRRDAVSAARAQYRVEQARARALK